jgi:hypothetical protein
MFGENQSVRLALILLAMMLSGCSWLMVAGPPPDPPQLAGAGAPGQVAPTPMRSPVGCTRQKFAPHVDRVFASFFGVGAAIMVAGGIVGLAVNPRDDYNQFMGVMMVGTGGLGLLLAWPWWKSSRSGYRDVEACRAAYIRAYGTYDMP